MKELLKNIFIPPLASRPVSALASHLLELHIPVFLVHQLVNDTRTGSGITPEHLRNCLRYLVKNGHNFVSLKDAIYALKNSKPLPEKPVVFTMDDGFMQQATITAPIFQEFNCPATFFVITDMLDRQLWPWDAKVSWLINNTKKQRIAIKFEDETLKLDLGNAEKKHLARYKTRDFIKETDMNTLSNSLEQVAAATGLSIPESPPEFYEPANWDIARKLEAGGFTFAPHSKTHRILSKMDEASARDEILGSWQRLTTELSDPLKVFCYPTGRPFDFGSREINILKDNDFLAAISTIPGYLTSLDNHELNLYALPRFDLPESMTDFIQYCTWIEFGKKTMHLY